MRLLCLFLAIVATDAVRAADNEDSTEPWKFVSIPDLMNDDVDYPDSRWDDALEYVLDAIRAEEPDFVLVAGDLVMGRWSHNREHLEKMAVRYYPAWTNRMRAHGLKYFTALGDHEIGDDPWQGEKRALVPHYKQAFREHLQMPAGGPPGFDRTTFAVRHKNLLMVAVDMFEQDADGAVQVRVGDTLRLRFTLQNADLFAFWFE
jgi:hypothetical protein